MTDEYRHSHMLGQCRELGSQIVRELSRALEIGVARNDSTYFAERLVDALILAKRIRDIHEEGAVNGTC